MDELQPYMGGGAGMMPLGQDVKAMRKTPTGRAIMRVQNAGMIRQVATDVEAALANVKLQAAGGLARAAQTEVAMLCQAEAALIQSCGNEVAAQRIDAVTQVALVGMAGLVMDGIDRLRRI